MAKVFILICVVLFSAGVLCQQQNQPYVVREKNNNDGSGNYLFTYELSNGQIFSEAGGLKSNGQDKIAVKSGAYSFVAPDGQTYWVTYTADEFGYHPVVGTGPGGIQGGQDAEINPNSLKSLVG